MELDEEKAYLAFVPFIYFMVDRKFGWRLFCALLLSSLTVITPKNVLKLLSNIFGKLPQVVMAVSTTFWSYLVTMIP